MSVKAVIDTNIWISAFVAPLGTAARLIDLWKKGRFTLIISEQQSTELYEVLSRSKFTTKYRVDEKKVEDLISSFTENAKHVLPEQNAINICRDTDDNVIIETAVSGRAKYLVTGDKDITDDKAVSAYLSQHSVTVISLQKFLSLIDKD